MERILELLDLISDQEKMKCINSTDESGNNAFHLAIIN